MRLELLHQVVYCVLLHTLYINAFLVEPDFRSEWQSLWLNKSSSESFRTVAHQLGEIPLLVDVQVLVTEGTNKGYIFQAAGHLTYYDDNMEVEEKMRQSGVIYLYDKFHVQVIATVKRNHNTYGRCSYTAASPYWLDPDSASSMSTEFRIRVWKASSLPAPSFSVTEVDIAAGTGLESEASFIYSHGFSGYPELVISRVRFPDTECADGGYHVDSLGATDSIYTPSHKTGVVEYGADQSEVRVWTQPANGKHLFIGIDDYGDTVTVNSGILEIYAWDSTDLTPNVTTNVLINDPAVNVSTAPGMTLDVSTPLATLLDNNVTFAQVLNTSIVDSNLTFVNISELMPQGQLINGSISISDILNETMTIEIPINQAITLGQLLNESLTLALLLNETGNQSVSLEELINGTITVERLINESSITLGHLIDKADTLWLSVSRSADTATLPAVGTLEQTFTRGLVQGIDANNPNFRVYGTGAMLWYEHNIIPTLCSFSGMVYGYKAISIRFWYPQNVSNCQELCPFNPTINNKISEPAQAIANVWILDTNECRSHVCKNGATCSNYYAGYNCTCADGWSGVHCTINDDDCATNPCQLTETCTDLVNGYKCTQKSMDIELVPYVVLGDPTVMPLIKATSEQDTISTSEQMIIIPGITSLDVPETSMIKNRYECTNYLLDVVLVNPNNISLTLLWLGSRCGKSATCSIDWGDGLRTEDVFVDKTATVLFHEYTEYAIYNINSACDDTAGISTCPEIDSTCVVTDDFLDNFNIKFSTPRVYYASAPLEINTRYRPKPGIDCGSLEFNWRLIKVDNNTLVPVQGFTQTSPDNLHLESGTLEPGVYIVFLEVMFPTMGGNYWTSDSIVLHLILPNLVAHISGSDFLHTPVGEMLYINATYSHDPALELAVTSLNASWSFVHIESDLTDKELQDYMEEFPQNTVPVRSNSTAYSIQSGTEYVLEVNTLFPANTYGVAIFTLSQGNATSSTFQVMKFVDNAMLLNIECLYKCLDGVDKLFTYDQVILEAALPDGIDTLNVEYMWTIIVWNGEAFETSEVFTETGYNQSKIIIPKSSVQQGYTYRIVVQVSAPEYSTSQADIVRTVNYIPYDGDCSATKNTVISAKEWLTVSCMTWLGNDNRKVRDANADINPLLSFVVRQLTAGAVVYEEPVIESRDRTFSMLLKTGDPNNGYKTSLHIRAVDMFKNYDEFVISDIVSMPVFEDVTKSEEGANIIQTYMETDFALELETVQNLESTNRIVSFISAVCSNVHLLDLPPKDPPVPFRLNTGGAILDLNPEGNDDIGQLNSVLEEANDDTIDPATLAVQDLMTHMTVVIRDIIDTYTTSTQKDSTLNTLITNALTNLGAKPHFLSNQSMLDILNMSKTAGIDAMETDDQIEAGAASGEVYNMSREISNTAVLADLGNYRRVADLKSARTQISNMLTVIGQNISLKNSVLSPVERAYLYQQMQRLLWSHTQEAKENVRTAARNTIDIAESVRRKVKLCSTCSNEHDSSTQQLLRNNKASVLADDMSKTETSQFKLDSVMDAIENGGGETKLSISGVEFRRNVFSYDTDGTSSTVTSPVLYIDVKTFEKKRVTPRSMTFEQTVITPDAELVKPSVDEEDASEFMYHKFLYKTNSDSVCLIIMPIGVFNFSEYLVYIKYSGPPSIIDFDVTVNVYQDAYWEACVHPVELAGHTGLIYLAVHLPGSKKTVEYNLTIATMGCLTWEEAATKWHTDKCELEWKSRDNKISCYCHDITDMVFSNSFFAAPNAIDFSTVFLKFSPLNQAAVMGTFCAILLIYIIAVIYLAGRDRRDKLKWGVTPLRDNLIVDRVYYIIKVMTGMRRDAGTRSRVAFMLMGEYEDTGPREMFDGVREEFGTGSVLTFLMATGDDLGDIQGLHIWHDNSGDGDYASWYLNQVDVYDVTRRKTHSFVAERWLSVETGVDAHLSSKPTDKPLQFKSRFFHHTRDRLSESHMWLSVLYRPQYSSFTRVQRASCALVYIMISMIANAMYFNPEPDYQSPALIQVGPLRFSARQIYVSVICALLTAPPTMLLIFLFKRTKSQPDRPRSGCCKRCICRCVCCNFFKSRCLKDENKQYEDTLRSKVISPGVPDFNSGFYLPHWCIYIAWLIVGIGTVVPAFFIILYSMEWGKQKSEEWLTTLLMSLLESMLLIDPIMVVCLAFLFALLMRSNTDDINCDVDSLIMNYRHSLGRDKDTVSSSLNILKSLVKEYRSYVSIPRTVSPPIKGDDLENAASKNRRHHDLMDILKDLLLNMAFLVIVLVICSSNRDDRSYFHHTNIVSSIVEPWKMPHFSKITNSSGFYKWINISVIPTLFPEKHLNGEPLHWSTREFMAGYTDLRLGPPRLRQLRTKKGICNIPYIGSVLCYGQYEMLDEEEKDYCVGWKEPPCPQSENIYYASSDAWTFTSALDIWGLPLTGFYSTYGGGGYIASFDINRNFSIDLLNELYEHLWMDRQTRAVILEFTLYNGATNMFIYNIFIVDFPETGGAFTSYSVYPLRVYTHQGTIGTLTLICEVFFVIYIIVLFVKLSVCFYQQRCEYFSMFWKVYELVILLACIAAVVLFAIRLGLTHSTVKAFKSDKKLFVNFSHIVLLDQMFVSVLGILAFLATMRMLEVFAGLKKVRAIVEVFDECGKDLFWYGMVFVQIFMGFVILAVLLFGHSLESYRNIYQCMGTLFIAIIGKSKFVEINETQPIVAKAFFMIYITVIVFIIMTVFLAILGSSIDNVAHKARDDPHDDLIDFIIQQVRSLVCKPVFMNRRKQYASSETGIDADQRFPNKSFLRAIAMHKPYMGNIISPNQVRFGPTQEVIDSRINRKSIRRVNWPRSSHVMVAE